MSLGGGGGGLQYEADELTTTFIHQLPIHCRLGDSSCVENQHHLTQHPPRAKYNSALHLLESHAVFTASLSPRGSPAGTTIDSLSPWIAGRRPALPVPWTGAPPMTMPLKAHRSLSESGQSTETWPVSLLVTF